MHWGYIFKGLFTIYHFKPLFKKQNQLFFKSTRYLSKRRELGRTPCHTITNHAKSNPRVNNHILNIHFTGYINSSSGAHTCPHTANQISFRRSVCSSVTEVGFAYVMQEEKTHCACLAVSQSVENAGGKRHENSRREWQLTESICTPYRRTIIVITCLCQAICQYNNMSDTTPTERRRTARQSPHPGALTGQLSNVRVLHKRSLNLESNFTFLAKQRHSNQRLSI